MDSIQRNESEAVRKVRRLGYELRRLIDAYREQRLPIERELRQAIREVRDESKVAA